jgi:hypothetical protein
MIRKHGNIYRFSADNLEHIHATRKNDVRNLSNKRLLVSRGRLHQTLKLEVVRQELNVTHQHQQSRYLKERQANHNKRKASELI